MSYCLNAAVPPRAALASCQHPSTHHRRSESHSPALPYRVAPPPHMRCRAGSHRRTTVRTLVLGATCIASTTPQLALPHYSLAGSTFHTNPSPAAPPHMPATTPVAPLQCATARYQHRCSTDIRVRPRAQEPRPPYANAATRASPHIGAPPLSPRSTSRTLLSHFVSNYRRRCFTDAAAPAFPAPPPRLIRPLHRTLSTEPLQRRQLHQPTMYSCAPRAVRVGCDARVRVQSRGVRRVGGSQCVPHGHSGTWARELGKVTVK